MAKRGRKPVDRTSWLRAGGPLPDKPLGLSKLELVQYKWLVDAMAHVGTGGASDLAAVTMAAKMLARAQILRDLIDQLPSPMIDRENGPALHPAYAELGRSESRIQSMLISLNLMPRTRSSTRLPAEQQVTSASVPDDNPILKLLGS